ncbi:LptF/LptG family permease [Myroides pelagicus]|uniref:LptF/LptG family permease n=1 Tax=Myroides pelagicus TaxID=270914 RepID=A0A7K1GM41_9FLAO|nr:LptF/LptG family permease [Myroides pelagicus]MEC4113337.1 LptF/LptG family permease [Myroides pelagicus]MTH29947.1 LptF/LptG family permease [Myroides pelagicus]
MKIIDRYILKSFVTTLATVFAILYFIFILQAVWLFITELAGKDLDVFVVIKFLLLYSPKMVPLVLPLSVLLASIMTFGSLAENYEFAAMKASGISLGRALRPLSVFISGLALLSFWFANNVIPIAEYEFINLRREIIAVKPAMAIAPGQFTDLGTSNIKVDKKTGDKGQYLDNVTMHMRGGNTGANDVVIRSVNGELSSSENSNLLSLHLLDGNYYRDLPIKNYKDRAKVPFMKVKFDKYTVNMDLAALNETENTEKVTNTYHMLNISQLSYTIDSLKKEVKDNKISYADNLMLRVNNLYKVDQENIEKSQQVSDSTATASKLTFIETAPEDLLGQFNRTEKDRVLTTAGEYVSNLVFNTETNDASILNQMKKVNSHYLALNEKFVIAYSCFLMFFIGAPLGAIIRKGGIGLPMVASVAIFITYHFINTFGRKVAQEDGMNAILGSWIGALALTPLAIFVTYKATTDNGDVNFMAVFDPFIDGFNFVKGKIKTRFAKKVKQQAE